MPKRPRSHRLEDISINRFSALLPEAWIVRQKEKDYGVDLEIEIVAPGGRLTGLMFYVQLRGTDDPKKAAKIALDVEQVEYFQSLTLPTIIVRYCNVEETFYWQWHFNVATELPAKQQKSFTYRYTLDELWNSAAPDAIHETLWVRRLVENYAATQPVNLRYDSSSLPFADRYTVDRAFQIVSASALGVLTNAADCDSRLSIDLQLTSSAVSLRIDCFASITVLVEQYDADDLANTVRYALAALFRRHRLTHHADRMARVILTSGKAHHSRFLAFEVCCALGSDLGRSVQLAILNGLHDQHDAFYPAYLAFLFRTPQDDDDRERAVTTFYDAALVSAHEVSPETAAAVYYSMGNFYRMRRNALPTVRSFNHARKLRPQYMATGYFLQELGACMFGQARYRCAAAIYGRAVGIATGPQQELHLADALLFSGNVADAKAHYENASETEDAILKYEAIVKQMLCDWLIDWVGQSPLPTRRQEADAALAAEGANQFDVWMEILTKIDATHEVAHFNLGVSRAKRKDYDKAVGNFLFCAFKQSGDLDAWANAIICANNAKEAAFIVAVMSCALSLGGSGSYDRLRGKLLEQSAEDGMIEGLDQVFRELSAMVEQAKSTNLTFRALADDSYDVAVIQ